MASVAALPNCVIEDTQIPRHEALERRPLVLVATVVALFYGAYLIHAVTSGYGPRSFIQLDRRLVVSSHVSNAIHVLPGFPYTSPTHGYDGQDYYLIALDPLDARYYVQSGTYYYTRALYPLTARLLALGRASLIPYTLILINLLAVVLGSSMLAAWLQRKRLSPWMALIYAAYPGVFIAFQRDLTEPMAYSLLATGIYTLEFGGRRRVVLAGLCFGLAVLTRDKAAILALVFSLGFLFGNRGMPPGLDRFALFRRALPGALALFGLTLVPYTVEKIVLYLWMHSLTLPANQQVAPLSGVLDPHVWGQSLVTDSLTALVPALVSVVVVVWAIARGARQLSVVALLLLLVVTTVTLNPVYFTDIVGLMRANTLVVMASLYAMPAVAVVFRGNNLWLYVCAAFWLSMTPALFIFSAPYLWVQVLTLACVLVSVGIAVVVRMGPRVLNSHRSVTI